ncbi:MAG: MFS transporter [Elusimicrobia bacterium]|nr:MFS transporter [Elusimicrobiota bacterium]
MRRRDFALVCAGQMLGLAALEAGLCATPAVLASLGAESDASLVFWTGLSQCAAAGFAIVAIPVWGRVGDRVGRGRMLVRAQAGLAAALALMALARSPWQVVLSRALQGAFAGTTPAALALVAGGADGARLMGWVRSYGLAGAVAGPLLGGLLLPFTGATALFVGGAVVCAVLAAASWGVREEPAASAPRVAAAGPGRLYAASAGLAFFRGLEDPLLPVVARTLAPGSWVALSGAGLSVSRGVQALVSPWWGRECERRGLRSVLAFCALGAGTFTAAQALAGTPGTLLAARAALGFFAAGAVAALYAAAGEAGERRGEAVAWTASGLRLGGAVAAGAAGPLAALVGIPATLIAAGAGVAAVPRLVFRREDKEEACAVSCSTGT